MVEILITIGEKKLHLVKLEQVRQLYYLMEPQLKPNMMIGL